MPKTEKIKPRLKSVDDLFTGSDTTPATQNAVTYVKIEKLSPFKGHPFKLYEGERLDDMVASIRANGVLVPIIVRKIDTLLEILAGHNRVNAAKLAGLNEVPTIILENISDEDAMVYVIETNLIQRSFSDMSHTEKAAVIALHYSKMFTERKQNSIIEHIKSLENLQEHNESDTLGQVDQNLYSRDKTAKEYNLSSKTVARYLRVNHLIPALKTRLDNDDLAFIPAVELSYLKDAEQELIAECVTEYGFAVTLKRADDLKSLSGKLDNNSVYAILSGEAKLKPKPNRTPTVKVAKSIYSKYFKPDQPAKEVQAIVEKALDLYFERHNLKELI